MLTEPEEPPDRARRGSVKSDDLEHFDATIKARVKAAVALGADAIVVSASELATARGRVDARATGDWARTVSAVGMGKHLAPDDPSAFIVCTPAASLVLRAGSAADRDAWVDAIASCLPGQHKSDSSSLQCECFARARYRKTHPRFETVPRDDRSSKNQPKRVENGRDMSL